MPHYGLTLEDISREEEEQLNMAMVLSRSEHESSQRKMKEQEDEMSRRRTLKSLQAANLFASPIMNHLLAPPTPGYQITTTPPRYSSLYRKEEPPSPFTYKSPRTAAAMRSQSRISPTEVEPPPYFRSTSYPGACTKTPFMISKTSYTIRVGTTPSFEKSPVRMVEIPQRKVETVSPITKGYPVTIVEFPVKTVERVNSGMCATGFCLCLALCLIIVLGLMIFAAVHFLFGRQHHHDFEDHHGGPDQSGFNTYYTSAPNP